jgi:hypothetical protein
MISPGCLPQIVLISQARAGFAVTLRPLRHAQTAVLNLASFNRRGRPRQGQVLMHVRLFELQSGRAFPVLERPPATD